MQMRIILVLLITISINFKTSASYNLNQNCKEAWVMLMELEIDKAQDLLAKEISQNPENYYAYYLQQSCESYTLLINSGEEEYESFLLNHEKRREIMNDKDEESPYYLACKAEMDLQVGIFNIIYGSKISGLRMAYSAYKNTYRNLEVHPEFKQSIKLDGFFNVAVSNLPPFVKFAVSAFGVSGNTEYGLKLLNENYSSQRNIKGINAESALFVILAAKLNKTPDLVYDFVNSLDSSISKTFIHTYFRANISYRTGHNEDALETLSTLDISNNTTRDIIYSYMMGKILLRKLDYNAGYFFERYLSFDNKREYVKEMNYKLACHFLLNNNIAEFERHKKICLKEGNNINERDREALYDAKLDYTPDINLLKAHLLLDGGYDKLYSDAIESYKSSDNNFLPYNLEFHLLEGTACERQGNHSLATFHFEKVIQLGSDEDYYFASEAALKLGEIYESENNVEKAELYYEKAIKLYDSDYYEYIDDKATKALKGL